MVGVAAAGAAATWNPSHTHTHSITMVLNIEIVADMLVAGEIGFAQYWPAQQKRTQQSRGEKSPHLKLLTEATRI